MFLIIAGIIIYLIYDYIEYKDDVDTAFEKSTNHMNNTFDKVSQNIDITEKNLSTKINQNKDNIKKMELRTDGIASKIKLNESDIAKLKNTDNIYDKKIKLNEGDIAKLKQTDNMYDKRINTLNNQSKNTDNDVNKFDLALKKYFEFSENNQKINNKLFKHAFSGIKPNLKLLSQVQAVNGLKVNTSINTINSQNLKVCNAQNNCMNLNVNNDGFNITPENINNLTINSTTNKPLAKFDLKNNSIYLGGSDINAPLFINNSNLFMNNINLLVKESGKTYKNNDINNMNKFRLTGEDLYSFGTTFNNAVQSNKSQINSTIESIVESANTTKKIIIHYSLNNVIRNANTPSVVENNLFIKFISSKNLNKFDTIEFEIPIYEIGSFTGYSNNKQNLTIKNISSANYINVNNLIIENKPEFIKITAILDSNIPEYTQFMLKISGNNIFTYINTVPIYGSTIGSYKSIKIYNIKPPLK